MWETIGGSISESLLSIHFNGVRLGFFDFVSFLCFLTINID